MRIRRRLSLTRLCMAPHGALSEPQLAVATAVEYRAKGAAEMAGIGAQLKYHQPTLLK